MRSASDRGITSSTRMGLRRRPLRGAHGQGLKEGYRQKVFLMTKSDSHSAAGWNKQIETSLRRLQTDMIDLVQITRSSA